MIGASAVKELNGCRIWNPDHCSRVTPGPPVFQPLSIRSSFYALFYIFRNSYNSSNFNFDMWWLFFAILTIFFDNHLVKLVFYLFEASSFDFKKSLLKLPSWHANKTEPNEIKTRTSTVCSIFYRRKLDVLKRKLVKSSSRWKNFQQS